MSNTIDVRVRVPKDKEDIINQLIGTKDSDGAFKLIAEVITFAASLGFKKGKRVSIGNTAEPIRQSVFISRGFDLAINLIAISETNDPNILSNVEEMEKNKIAIFEEYANGGLEILRRELVGQVDVLNHLLLLIKEEYKDKNDENDDVVLSDFI